MPRLRFNSTHDFVQNAEIIPQKANGVFDEIRMHANEESGMLFKITFTATKSNSNYDLLAYSICKGGSRIGSQIPAAIVDMTPTYFVVRGQHINGLSVPYDILIDFTPAGQT